LEVDKLVPERVDVPEGAQAVIVDRTHVSDPEVQFIELRKSLSEGDGAVEEDTQVLFKKEKLGVRSQFLMPIAKGFEHFMAGEKVIHIGEISGGNSFLNEALKGDVVREPYVLRLWVEDPVGTGEGAVEIRKETLPLHKEFRAGAPFTPVGLIQVQDEIFRP
jgi:hypothetical protein